MTDSVRSSFTSADSVPVKMLLSSTLVRSIATYGRVLPIHAQIIPTNKCNLTCSFCSCSEEDRDLVMSPEDMHQTLVELAKCGTEALTITGGGEPTLYPWLPELVQTACSLGISSGLVTNGTTLTPIDAHWLGMLSWCRISQGDDREELTEVDLTNYIETARSTPDVDWAFSYVVGTRPNLSRVKQIIALSEVMRCTHVRLVADLLQPDKVPMAQLEKDLQEFLQTTKVPVIFQARTHPTRGSTCLIPYLKPVISPDLKVYACCGVQYALDKPSKRLPEELCLGTLDEYLMELNSPTTPFEGGEMCSKCYYGNYNSILHSMLQDVRHLEFV